MSPGLGLSIRALRMWVGTLLLIAAPAAAGQSYDDARRLLDLAPDPILRSPRLLGMGRLTLLGDDPNNRITLWDFAGNPIGVLDTDTLSTFELRPGTASSSSVHDRVVDPFTLERQDLAAREMRMGVEAWHHSPEGATFGLIGDLGQLRLDRPFSENVERRSHFKAPSAMPILAGPFPYLMSEHLRYALRLVAGAASSSDRYRQVVRNGAGEYIDRNGDIGDPPDFFTPDEYSIRTIGGGAALGYEFGAPLSVAVGYDRVGLRIKGDNTGGRYDSETEETRPYDMAQASAVGRMGPLEWGADARGWRATSKEMWVFTISAGPAATPFTGRGKLLDRKEEGSLLSGRVRLHSGDLELGGGGHYGKRTIDIFAPSPTDPTSFNAFLNRIFNTPVISDTLILPDSVRSSSSEETEWEVAGGLGWRMPWRRGLIGVEYHMGQQQLESDVAGLGPKRVLWDVRAGVEVPVTPVLAARAGFLHRSEDRDDLTERNEYLSNGVTLGTGIRPEGASWTVEAGYLIEWSRADFGDPGEPHGSRQQGAMQVRWSF